MQSWGWGGRKGQREGNPGNGEKPNQTKRNSKTFFKTNNGEAAVNTLSSSSSKQI